MQFAAVVSCPPTESSGSRWCCLPCNCPSSLLIWEYSRWACSSREVGPSAEVAFSLNYPLILWYVLQNPGLAIRIPLLLTSCHTSYPVVCARLSSLCWVSFLKMESSSSLLFSLAPWTPFSPPLYGKVRNSTEESPLQSLPRMFLHKVDCLWTGKS